jgi:hypothetical protein
MFEHRAQRVARVSALAVCVAITLLGLSVAYGTADAAPIAKIRGEAVPIPGFRHTGNILGAGAAVRAELQIIGNEYFGAPAPLIGVTVFLPAGVKLYPSQFPTCPRAVIFEQKEPRACPSGSRAGHGVASGVVSLGNERVHETATIEAFYGPHDTMEFFTFGHSPVVLEIPSEAHYVTLTGGNGYGPVSFAEIPLVEDLPGAPDASVENIKIELGSAIRRHGKAIYYGTVPKTCPKGGFRVKVELTFAGLSGLTQQTVVVPFRSPCPRR